jgi:hypothetical protein
MYQPMRKLLILTAAVVAAHVLLLGSVTGSIGFHLGRPDADASAPQPLSFETRTVQEPAPPARAATVPAPNATTAKPARPPKPDTPAQPQAVTPTSEPTAQVASSGLLSPEPDARSAAIPLPPASAPVELPVSKPEPVATPAATPSPLAASTAAAAGAEVRRAKKVSYSEGVRLVFDGKGEEKGYIKYNASGELLWLPDAMQYSAKLELSAFGFRLRTWTSKGELTDNGLQPIRFGDKPRGAEQATHFQRDKGIISFSANNPDVPLQAGAQDKLSALLQLSAMVAGDPGQYPSGSVISFQAADAHRAELWDFKVGATETLDLPGGTLNGIKLSKEPTVEFDQRIEVWLAPDMRYLPVRLRITEASGAFADLLWRKSQKPE